MKLYQTLAGVAVALAWTVAGAQTNTPNSSDAATAPQAVAQQAAPKNATESQPDNAANKDTNPTQAGTMAEPSHKASGKTSAKKTHVAHHTKHSKQSKSAKSTKTAHSTGHTAKTTKSDRASPPEQTLTKDEREYRSALRQCAGEKDQSLRDSCLDGAIEQFRRNG